MAMSTKESGAMIRHTGSAAICTLMGQSTKATGRKTNSMAKARKHGPMVLNTRETTLMERKTAEEASDGPTVPLTKVNSPITIFMESVFTFGLTLASMMASGRTIRCMEEEFSLGQMAGDTRVTTSMTRSRVTASLPGLMVADTMANGTTVNSMERASISLQKGRPSAVNGKMERELDG